MCNYDIPTCRQCKHQKDRELIRCTDGFDEATGRCNANKTIVNIVSYDACQPLCTRGCKQAEAPILEHERERGHEASEAYRELLRSETGKPQRVEEAEAQLMEGAEAQRMEEAEAQLMEEADAEHKKMPEGFWEKALEKAMEKATAEIADREARRRQALEESRERQMGEGW